MFECLADAARLALLRAKLTDIIDPKQDSLRFCRLGHNDQAKAEHVGLSPAYAQDDVLLF